MTSLMRFSSSTRQTCYMRWSDLSPHPINADEGDTISGDGVTMRTDLQDVVVTFRPISFSGWTSSML